MYDQFLAKSFHNPDFGDQQFGDVNNQNNNNTGQVGRDVRGMTPNSDSNDRQNLSQNRQVAVSTGMSPSPETPHQAPGYPPNFFSAPMSQEQLYNARLSYSQHINYQQYKQQLMHQMGAYNPLEMLQQGYGMGPPAPPQQQISAPPPVQQQQQPSPQQQQQQQQQTQQQQQQPPPQQQHPVPEIVNEDSDDSVAQAQMYAGMKRPSPDNCFVNNNQKKPKPQKKKKKKDPNEPQKPVSAYALFFRDTQAAIKGQNPNASFGEVSKIVASMWDTLDVEHKNVYKRKTEDAKKDYLKALAAYRASLVSKSGRECETNTPQQINSGFPASNNVYNGYNQHGYSPPTSVAGGTEHHNQNQRVTHHHQGYSPPPSKIEHGTQHTQHLHHGYSQTPGGGVMTDNRATQLSHPYNQQSNQDHRMAHHHHGYSPTAQQDSKSSHSSYSSSSSGPSPGSFNDSHSNSQERNSQLGTHYHGYSPPRSLADASHQINPQYVTAGHGRLPGNYQNANDNSRMTNNYQNSGNVNENQSRMTNNVNTHYQNESMQNNQQNSNYQDNVRSHHHYPQLGNSSSQGDIRQNQSQQTGNQAHHYSASPGSNAQETHQASSQTGAYQNNQSNETHHQMSTQTYSQPNNEHQMHTNSQSTQYPNPSGETHHHAGTQSGYHSPNTEHHQQHNYQQQNNDMHRMHHYQQQYNGYSPRYDGYSPSGSLPSPASQTQPIMNQECIQQQPQQSQVMVGRHMAGPTPGAQHMTPIHQPPTM